MLLLISIIVFGALELTPGDPLSRMLSPEQAARMTDAQKEAFREAVGLNGPVYIRYFKWLGNVLRGDFGKSLVSGMDVSQLLANRIPATIELAGWALVVSTILGILFGVVAAARQNSWVDYLLTALGVVGISVPEFFVGIVGIQLFAIKLKWLPTGGRTVFRAASLFDKIPPYIMPVGVLALGLTAVLIRYARGSMLDVMNKDYIKTALSKGIPISRVYIRHGLRNALMPIMNLLCFRLPLLIGGSVIIEQVFIWPGMGQSILEAISSKDFPVVLMATMLTGSIVLVASFLVDMFTALLDPRVRINK